MAPRNIVPNSPLARNAPRRGIGGVTLENVANVRDYGSRAMPQNAPIPVAQPDRFRALSRPTVLPPQRSVSSEDLDAFLFGDVSATAGEKYAGFPTQTAYETAITGRAYDILEQANLAKQLALADEARIAADVQAAEDERALRNATEIAELEQQLPTWQNVKNNTMTRTMQGLPTVLENLGRAKATQQFVLPEAAERGAEAALTRLEREVDPRLAVAEDILAYSPSELAQTIATRQYGMNPQLAAGTFGPDFEKKYYADMVALDAAQRDYERMQAGFYPETMDETIFRIGGADALEEYRLNAAESAMGTDPESLAEEQEREQSGFNDQVDQTLAQNYFGLTPGEVSSKVDEPVIRSVMADPTFQGQFVELAEMFQPGGSEFNMADTQEMRRMKINELAFDRYGATIQATVLADLVASWSLTGP